MPVHRSGEGDAGNDRDRLRLRMRARPALQVQAGVGAAVCQRFAPVFISSAVRAARHVLRVGREARQRDVETVVIRGRSPVDAARCFALGRLGLPEDLAGVIGIETVDHAGRCPARMTCLPLARVRRIGELSNSPAPLSWRVGLLGPAQLAVAQVECDDRIGQRLIDRRCRSCRWRRTPGRGPISMVGEARTGTPAGPNSCTPALFLRYGRGSSLTV